MTRLKLKKKVRASSHRLLRIRNAAFGADFEAQRDGFLDVFQRLRFGFTLTHATGNRRTLGYPNSVLIAVKDHRKFHIQRVTDDGTIFKRASNQRIAL